jgi:6-pyruvoyl-tetrahydropterin synthase
LSTDEWGDNIVDGKRMEARQGHCAVSLDNQVYVFGGSHTWEHVFNDIVVLRNPASPPSPSSVVTSADESFSDALTRKLYESTLMMTAGYSPTELTASQIKDMIAAEAKLRKDIDEDHDANYLNIVAETLLSWKKAEPIYENIQKLKADFAKTHLNITAQLALIDEAVKEHNEYNDIVIKLTREFTKKLSALRHLEDEAAFAIRK